MTTAQLNTVGYIIKGREVEEIWYREYLREYGSDKTTSPNGIAPRIHIREVMGGEYKHVSNDNILTEEEYNELSEEGQECYNWYGEKVNKYQIWSWGINGNHPSFTGTTFETEEDAEIEIYEHFENYIQDKNWNAPIFCNTMSEVITEMANAESRSKEVITRYLKLAAITVKKNEIERLENEKLIAEFKIKNDATLKAEIAIILPLVDDAFKIDLKEAQKLTGNEKSKACSVAMVGLLNRIGYGNIKSDFWKVFRTIKNAS